MLYTYLFQPFLRFWNKDAMWVCTNCATVMFQPFLRFWVAKEEPEEGR